MYSLKKAKIFSTGQLAIQTSDPVKTFVGKYDELHTFAVLL